MPLDQMCLLSLTSTRTSAVFMTLWANFFTCGREGAGKGEGGEPSVAMHERRANPRRSRSETATLGGRTRDADRTNARGRRVR
jgi:hypothetical protein